MLLSVLREVANLVSKGIFKKGRDLPYYALFIDSETYNQTMDFLTESFEELQKIQKEFNVFKIESDASDSILNTLNSFWIFCNSSKLSVKKSIV